MQLGTFRNWSFLETKLKIFFFFFETESRVSQTGLEYPVGINFLQPTFNKGSTSPLAHHPAEVVEEKSY